MNNNNEGKTREGNGVPASRSEGRSVQAPQRSRTALAVIVAIAATAGVAIAAWALWPGKAGKPVPVPRADSLLVTVSLQVKLKCLRLIASHVSISAQVKICWPTY